jgi:hypothetical protein
MLYGASLYSPQCIAPNAALGETLVAQIVGEEADEKRYRQN